MTARHDPHGHDAPAAMTGSPLTCFGVSESATRLYFLDGNYQVNELALTADGWDGGSLLVTTAPDSSLTCFGVGGKEPRVYYVDPDRRIIELAWSPQNAWVSHVLPGEAAPDSPLSCFGQNGLYTLLYYVGTDRQVHELAWGGAFFDTPLLGPVAVGSGLTCHQDNQQHGRVFYVSGGDHLIHVLSWEADDWGDRQIEGTKPAPQSPLTCFGLDHGGASRVYYLDINGQINEMAWTGDQMVNHPLGYEAAPGSSLTCFGVGGKYTRLYYLDGGGRINELAWSNGGWANHVRPGTASPESALTCFGVNGTATRLYYVDPDNRVNEMAWQANQFVNSIL